MKLTTCGLLHVFFTFLASVSSAEPSTLSLNTYLEQVKEQSPSIQSSQLIIAGSTASAREGDFIYSPRFTFDGSLTRDERQFANNFISGRTSSNNTNFALEKQFDFGLSARLSHYLNNNLTTGLNANFFPGGQNAYTSAQSQLELSLPLWRNFFGKETRAQETSLEASSLVNTYLEKFKLKQTLAQAESTYYRLSIARESVKLLNEVMNRSDKILKWNTRRVGQHLADRIDMLQAQSAFQSRQLDLNLGLTEQKSAELAFNILRNSSATNVEEELNSTTDTDLLSLQTPTPSTEPNDVKAAEQTQRLASANHELAGQKVLPDLSLYSTIGYNGLDRWQNPAVSSSFSTKHPLYMVGVKLTLPLYFIEASDIRAGRIKQELGAEAQYRQKKLEQSQVWFDLVQKFNEVKTRLGLANELVKMQNEKLKYEKYRYDYGRTTTYQVLTFEQDYAGAVLSRLKIQQELLALYSQMRTYTE